VGEGGKDGWRRAAGMELFLDLLAFLSGLGSCGRARMLKRPIVKNCVCVSGRQNRRSQSRDEPRSGVGADDVGSIDDLL
jgi:hypothetical protein